MLLVLPTLFGVAAVVVDGEGRKQGGEVEVLKGLFVCVQNCVWFKWEKRGIFHHSRIASHHHLIPQCPRFLFGKVCC